MRCPRRPARQQAPVPLLGAWCTHPTARSAALQRLQRLQRAAVRSGRSPAMRAAHLELGWCCTRLHIAAHLHHPRFWPQGEAARHGGRSTKQACGKGQTVSERGWPLHKPGARMCRGSAAVQKAEQPRRQSAATGPPAAHACGRTALQPNQPSPRLSSHSGCRCSSCPASSSAMLRAATVAAMQAGFGWNRGRATEGAVVEGGRPEEQLLVSSSIQGITNERQRAAARRSWAGRPKQHWRWPAPTCQPSHRRRLLFWHGVAVARRKHVAPAHHLQAAGPGAMGV